MVGDLIGKPGILAADFDAEDPLFRVYKKQDIARVIQGVESLFVDPDPILLQIQRD